MRCQKTNLDFGCQLHKIQGEYVIERVVEHTNQWIRQQLCEEESFKEGFIQVCNIYQQCTEFDRDNLKQIAIDCISKKQIPFQMYMSTENSANRSLKTRSLLTKFGTCNITATGAVTI